MDTQDKLNIKQKPNGNLCVYNGAEYHVLKILFPFNFTVKHNKFMPLTQNFEASTKIWDKCDADTNTVDDFINDTARIHSEIYRIFKNGNFFALYRLRREKGVFLKFARKMSAFIKRVLGGLSYINTLTVRLADVRLYLFESGIGFIEFAYQFNRFIDIKNNTKIPGEKWKQEFCKRIVQCDFPMLRDVCYELLTKSYIKTPDKVTDDRMTCFSEDNGLFFFKKPHFYFKFIKDSDIIQYNEPGEQANVKEAEYICGFINNRLDRITIEKDKSVSYKQKLESNIISVGDDRFMLSAQFIIEWSVRYKWAINDQSTWFSYVYVLYQRYYLRKLSERLADIGVRKGRLDKKLLKEEKGYANFRKLYVFENISYKATVEYVYDAIRAVCEINKLSNEYESSVKPLRDHVNKSLAGVRTNILFAISLTTVINIILTCFMEIFPCCRIGIFWSNIIIVGAILLLTALYTVLGYFLGNRAFKFKLKDKNN